MGGVVVAGAVAAGSWLVGKVIKKKADQAAAKSTEEQAAADAALVPPAETQTPSLSDQAIQDAILAERNRALAGNSRKQAFSVGNPNTSSLGT
jgi:hypothetical protein